MKIAITFDKLLRIVSFISLLLVYAGSCVTDPPWHVSICREVFQDFDPINVSKLNEKKIATPGSSASSLLSEVKLRGIIENARHTCKVYMPTSCSVMTYTNLCCFIN